MTQMYDPHKEWGRHPFGCVCIDCKSDALSDLVKLIHDKFDKSLQNMTDRAHERDTRDTGDNSED